MKCHSEKAEKKKYYEDYALVEMLSELEIDEVEKIEAEFLERYPNSRHYVLLCAIAKSRIKASQKKIEFVSLIEQHKNTPPDVAASSEVK